jgi:hypothetical protein
VHIEVRIELAGTIADYPDLLSPPQDATPHHAQLAADGKVGGGAAHSRTPVLLIELARFVCVPSAALVLGSVRAGSVLVAVRVDAAWGQQVRARLRRTSEAALSTALAAPVINVYILDQPPDATSAWMYFLAVAAGFCAGAGALLAWMYCRRRRKRQRIACLKEALIADAEAAAAMLDPVAAETGGLAAIVEDDGAFSENASYIDFEPPTYFGAHAPAYNGGMRASAPSPTWG